MSDSLSSPRTPGKARILIVDDFPLVRRGIAGLIGDEADLVVCGEAGDREHALSLIKALEPDLVIVDLSLRDSHGIALIEEVSACGRGVKMLVLSVHEESLYAERVLRAGALGYVNKQEAAETLIHAIREVLAGRLHVSAAVSRRLLHTVLRGPTAQSDPIASLSNRELQVFEMIGQGLPTKKIAAQLQLSRKTIEAHREKIKTKLNLSSGVELGYRAAQWVLEGQRSAPAR